MEEMLSVIEVYKDEFRKNNDINRCYLAPDIPDKIRKKLVKYFDSNLAVNSLVAFFDSTILGTAKNGFLFTNDGMYYKGILEKVKYFAYKDMYGFRVEKDDLYFEIENSDMDEYKIIDTLDMETLKKY